jgi:hypothetical protein
VLSKTAIVTPYFGLDVHSFILALLGILSGFQLVIFGTAAALYSVEAGCMPCKWLVIEFNARSNGHGAIRNIVRRYWICGQH